MDTFIKWNELSGIYWKSNFVAGTYYTQLKNDEPSRSGIMKRSHSSPNIAQVSVFILLTMCV